MAAPITRRRFTVEEYHRMAEAGILGEDDRLELVDGEIVEMAPIGRRHYGRVNRISHLFHRLFGDSVVVHVQNPIVLSEIDQPQPDIALLRWRADYYADVDASAGDALLLVEVADSSLLYDRQVKVPLYARHGIPELWLADLTQSLLMLYRDPTPDGYLTVQVLRIGDHIVPLAFPDVSIPVADILG
jgi:Uma2 family endonuclease